MEQAVQATRLSASKARGGLAVTKSRCRRQGRLDTCSLKRRVAKDVRDQESQKGKEKDLLVRGQGAMCRPKEEIDPLTTIKYFWQLKSPAT